MTPSWLFDPVRNSSLVLRRWFLFLLLVHLVTATFSYGIFHCDEHFQIIEFIGYKLGWVPASGLAWEFESQIRPWLQPLLFFIPVKALMGAGMTNPLTLELVLRLLSGLLGWGSLAILSRTLFSFLGRTQKAFWITLLFSSFYFLPQFHVRTSSESMSTAFLMLAFAQCLNPQLNPARFTLVGFLLGLSFEARYQTAIAGLGLALWLFFTTRQKLQCAVFGTLGGVSAMVLGALADRWGYGTWVFPAYSYLKVNLIEGKAASFGVSPWWDYFTTFRKSFIGPYGIALISGVLVALAFSLKSLRRPSTSTLAPEPALTTLAQAAIATLLPFFIVHSLIGHKENRFLYPVVWAMWLVALIQLGIPLQAFFMKHPHGQRWLSAAFALHVALTFVLLVRNAFTELETRAPLLAALQSESEKVPALKLKVLDGFHPYSMGCGGAQECGSKLISEFTMPKNLEVDCSSTALGAPQGSLVLQTFNEAPVDIPQAPAGCRTLRSTLPGWVPSVASSLPEGLRPLVFKKFRFHVLWDCRG